MPYSAVIFRAVFYSVSACQDAADLVGNTWLLISRSGVRNPDGAPHHQRSSDHVFASRIVPQSARNPSEIGRKPSTRPSTRPPRSGKTSRRASCASGPGVGSIANGPGMDENDSARPEPLADHPVRTALPLGWPVHGWPSPRGGRRLEKIHRNRMWQRS
jgi:hypothetical protein